jgi:hypothetical protein
MMFVSFKGNTTCATYGAGPAHQYGVSEFIPNYFVEVVLLNL